MLVCGLVAGCSGENDVSDTGNGGTEASRTVAPVTLRHKAAVKRDGAIADMHTKIVGLAIANYRSDGQWGINYTSSTNLVEFSKTYTNEQGADIEFSMEQTVDPGNGPVTLEPNIDLISDVSMSASSESNDVDYEVHFGFDKDEQHWTGEAFCPKQHLDGDELYGDEFHYVQWQLDGFTGKGQLSNTQFAATSKQAVDVAQDMFANTLTSVKPPKAC